MPDSVPGSTADPVNGDMSDPAVREAKQAALYKLCTGAMATKGKSALDIFYMMKDWVKRNVKIKGVGVVDGKIATFVYRQLKEFEAKT